jgi:prepilin-type processing-associated H-X9-DG protein/prepilin-type N-terminal cleavage/methylation domain-containing protein
MMVSTSGRGQAKAFSLVEILVAIAVVGVLVGLTLPAVQWARHAAARSACQDHLKQVGLALHNYHAAHGRLPPLPPRADGQPDPNLVLGWMGLILPQIGEDGLYRESVRACRIDAEPLHNPPHIALSTVIKAYACPSDSRLLGPQTDRWGTVANFTSYVGVSGSFASQQRASLSGIFGERPGIPLTDVSDGTSQTLMVGERPPPDSFQAGWWYPIWQGGAEGRGPNHYFPFGSVIMWLGDDECSGARRGYFGPGRLDNRCDRYHFWSLHPGGGNWLFADGSVRFLAYSADPIMPALATRAGGEAVTVPD